MSNTSGKPPEIMTFNPTMEEFRNFSLYIEHMESKGAHLAGVARVIPPKEWCPRKDGYDTNDVLNFKIQNPIDQKAYGKQGIFTLWNIAKWKSMDVRKFKEMSETKKYKAPVEDYEELERKYWKSLSLNNNSPIYGADTPGSFYDPDVNEWNITRLGTILNDVMTTQKIEGVNTAYLYFGMWRSTFCWHTEDMDLYSINYLHHGEPKFWYAIPPEHSERFERMASNFFSNAVKQCKSFLRHKMYLISPSILKNYSIPVSKVIQEQGQFIVTFPRGYHAGFNMGYNIAESTNFGSVRWIDFGKTASLCECKPDSVRIDMSSFVHRYQRDQYDDWLASQNKNNTSLTYSSSDESVAECSTSVVSKRHPIMNVKKKLCKRSLSSNSESSDCALVDSETKAQIDELTSKLVCNTKSTKNHSADSNWDPGDPYGHGLWAKPLEHLWNFRIFNEKAEIEFNRCQALIEPHCCLCQYFVPKALTLKTEVVPEYSRRILTDLSFIRNTETAYVPIADGQELDQLLTCMHCRATVHTKCYGAQLNGKPKSSWTCERCRLAGSSAECQLCCLRGGIMRPTNDSEWVHVVCALFCPDTKFNYGQPNQTIVLKPRKETELAKQDCCMYCKSNSGQPITCGQIHFPCGNMFHVTCGNHAGASFELRDWPVMVQAVCSDHNGPADQQDDKKKRLVEGDWVYAKRADNNYFKGKICGSQMETFCVVDFDDGSFSNNVYVQDLIDCSCTGVCNGAHAAGARVKIFWVSDGKNYDATFRRAYQVPTYNVRLENGEIDRCTKDELVRCDELPEEIIARKKVKFTKAEKKFTHLKPNSP